ncbi:MAG: hypothetical protein ACP5I4_17000 [Oceanipulchritudo sp.]
MAVAALLFPGCATQYAIRVDALSAGERGATAGPRTYELASATPGVEEGDLFFKEVARYLEPVLRENGYRRVEPGTEAGLRIAVDAHLSEPLVETRSYSDPVYVHTSGYSGAIRVPVLDSEGKVVRYRYYSYYEPPRMELSGWVHRDRQFTVYDKVLRLSAREILAGGSLSEELWTLTVSLRSDRSDYRSALPYLLVAARPYIGERTEGEEVILLKEDSEEVRAFADQVGNVR